jgi:hypothetical protein
MSLTIEHDIRRTNVKINGRDRLVESIASLFGEEKSGVHLLQGGVRSIWKATRSKDTSICLYEEPPTLRRITFKHRWVDYDGEHQTSEEEYHVWTPWTVYFIMAAPTGASILYMYFAKSEMDSMDHPLFFPSLPNIYSTEYTPGRVCNGQLQSNVIFNGEEISWQGTIAGLMSDFWSSVYNDDIMAFQDMNPFTIIQGLSPADALTKEMPTIHHGMKNWEKLSLDQVLAIPYHYLFNLSHIYDKMFEEYGLAEENSNQKVFGSLYAKLIYRYETLKR